MKWNWQQADWPHFSYDPSKIAASETRLLLGAGLLFGLPEIYSAIFKQVRHGV